MDDEVRRLEARVRELEDTLFQRDKAIGPVLHLPGKAADLLGLLITMKAVSVDTIMTHLQVSAEGAKVHVFHLRQRMKPYGIGVKNTRGAGYWIDNVDKVKIRALITSGVEVSEDEADKQFVEAERQNACA